MDDSLDYKFEECITSMKTAACPFTEREKEIIDSLNEQYETKRSLTDPQLEVFNRLYRKLEEGNR